MPIRAVIFDLDGTLLDTLADIAAAGNHALGELGRDPYPLDDYKWMVGEGADVLMQRAMPDVDDVNPGVIAEAVARFKAYYVEHPVDHSVLYPGMAELLNALVERGLPIAILSNKPHANTLLVADRLLTAWPWAIVMGHRDDRPKKPDPTTALEIASELNLTPAECAFVGDTMTDMQTATHAGMLAVGVEWGFRDRAELTEHGADHIITHPTDLLPLLP